MSEENVVLFVSETRGGMARRGAPDKGGSTPTEPITLRCPSCGSDFHLEADWVVGHSDVLCGRCETEIPLPKARKVVR